MMEKFGTFYQFSNDQKIMTSESIIFLKNFIFQIIKDDTHLITA